MFKIKSLILVALLFMSFQGTVQSQASLQHYSPALQQITVAENSNTQTVDILTNTSPSDNQINKAVQPASPAENAKDMPILKIMLFAFLGGLILNLMPCVFPILSIKVLSIKSFGNRKTQGIYYTLGVLFSFLTIALIIIIFEHVGRAVGWGFQMQSSAFVIALIFLFTMIACNLFGLYEVPFTMNASHKWAGRHKIIYSFVSGILASLVTTPCSAPFMATALGFAISMEYWAAILIFLTLGFGFAFPFLLFCWLPNSSAILPKPGAWMKKLRQFLGFPILLTVIWLLWVASYQMNIDCTIMILVSICFVQFSIWLWKSISNKSVRIAVVLLSLPLIIYPLYWIHQNLAGEASTETIVEYSPERLNNLLSQHRKVFVYATATWCITCQMNEKVALETTSVKEFFQKNNIVVMKADWTNKNNEILDYLKSFNREGIPLYVYYAKDNSTTILPQFLVPSVVINTLTNSGI